MAVSAYVQSTIFLILAALALFASAGTVAIVGFWLYLAILAAIIAASLLALDPGLFRERMRPGGKRPPLGLRLFTIVMFVHWIAAGLDRGRFHWSDNVPAWLQAVGLIALAASYALCFWAMLVNRFFSSVVRIQSDRGQHVVAGGPYAFVRHPGYLAGIVIILASGPALGSWLSPRRCWSSRACHSCFTAPSPRTACSRRNWRATPTMRAVCVGGCCRAFGEAEQGFAVRGGMPSRQGDSHKRYYGT
jgi:protein-S-isoprenylcysteine O-methyltransferase Ste14